MGSEEEDILQHIQDAAELQAWLARFLEDEGSAGQFPFAAFQRFSGDPAAIPPNRVIGKTTLRRWLQEYDLAQAINKGDIGPYLEIYHGHGFDYTRAEYHLANLIVNGPQSDAAYADQINLLTTRYDDPPAVWRRVVARICARCARQAGKALAWAISTRYQGGNRVGSRPGLLKLARPVRWRN
jgi:hypothetical protein